MNSIFGLIIIGLLEIIIFNLFFASILGQGGSKNSLVLQYKVMMLGLAKLLVVLLPFGFITHVYPGFFIEKNFSLVVYYMLLFFSSLFYWNQSIINNKKLLIIVVFFQFITLIFDKLIIVLTSFQMGGVGWGHLFMLLVWFVIKVVYGIVLFVFWYKLKGVRSSCRRFS